MNSKLKLEIFPNLSGSNTGYSVESYLAITLVTLRGHYTFITSSPSAAAISLAVVRFVVLLRHLQLLLFSELQYGVVKKAKRRI